MNHQHTDDSLSSAQTDVGMKGVAARVSLRVSEYERQLAGMSDVVKGREQDTLLAAIRAADEEDASVGESAKSLRARPVDQRSNITGVGSLLAPMLGNLNANLNIVAAAPILQNFNENLSLLRVSTPRTLARAQTPRQAAISLGSRNKREEDLRSFADQPDSREQSKDPWQPRVSEHKPSVSQEEAQLAFKEHYKEFETVLGKANDLAQRQAQQHHEIRKHMIGLEQETVEGKKQIEDTVRRFHEERQSLNEKIRLLHDVDEKYKLSIASMMTNFQKTEDASNKKMRDMEAAFKQQVLALDAALTTSHNAEISAMKKELEDLKATSEKQLDEFSQQSKEFRAIEEAANKKMQGMEEVFREQISVLETQVAKLQQPELSESDEACCKLPSALNEAQRAQMSGMGEELEGMREAFEERLHEYHEQGKHVMGDLEERCEGQVAAMQQQMHSIEKLSHNFAQREREGHTLTHSHTYSHTHTQSGLATLQQLPSLESPALVPQELSVSSLSAGAAEGSSSEQRMELYSASTPPLENLSPVPTFVGLEVANTALTGVLTPKVQRKHREQQQQFSTRECAVLRLRAVVEQEGDKEVQQPGPEQPLTLEDYATRLLAECLEHGGVVWESPETECKLIQEGQIEGQMKMERQGQTAGRGEAIKSGEVDGYGLDDRNYDALTQGQKLNMAAKMEKDDEEQEDDCLARWLPQAQARDTILNRIDALPAGAEDASDDATLSSTSECLPSPGQDVAEDHHASIFGTSNNMLASGAVESCAMKARQPPSPTCVEPPEPQGSGATRIPDSNSEYSILRLPKILSPLSVPSLCSAAEMVPEMMREGVALEAFSPGGRKGTDGRCLGSAAPQASLASQQESIASTCPSFTMHSARSPSGSVEQRESDRSGEGKHEAVEERLKKTEDQRMRGEGDEDQRVFSGVGDPPPAPAYHVQSSAQNSQASAFDRWLSPGVSRLVASLGDAGEAFFSARRYSLPVTQRNTSAKEECQGEPLSSSREENAEEGLTSDSSTTSRNWLSLIDWSKVQEDNLNFLQLAALRHGKQRSVTKLGQSDAALDTNSSPVPQVVREDSPVTKESRNETAQNSNRDKQECCEDRQARDVAEDDVILPTAPATPSPVFSLLSSLSFSPRASNGRALDAQRGARQVPEEGPTANLETGSMENLEGRSRLSQGASKSGCSTPRSAEAAAEAAKKMEKRVAMLVRSTTESALSPSATRSRPMTPRTPRESMLETPRSRTSTPGTPRLGSFESPGHLAKTMWSLNSKINASFKSDDKVEALQKSRKRRNTGGYHPKVNETKEKNAAPGGYEDLHPK